MPAVKGQWALLVNFAHYPVTAPSLSHGRRRGRAHDAHPLATARALGPYFLPTLSPHLATSFADRAQLTFPLPTVPQHRPENHRVEPELRRHLASARARDRNTPKPCSRLIWCRHCVRARSPPAPPELHLGRDSLEVKIADHLPFSLSLFLPCLWSFAGEGRHRCFTAVLCPSGQLSMPPRAPLPCVIVGHGQRTGLYSRPGKTMTLTSGAHW